nr:hypothetical protein [Tanacetum cinerariifolium]
RLLRGLPVVLVSGERDEYVTPEKLAAQAAILGRHGAQVTIESFEGKHTMHPPLLRQLHGAL